MSQQLPSGSPATSYNNDYLHDKPITDFWSVVLTKQPTANVVINVTPTGTRTYNADQAFNADAGFGENEARQVRVATNQSVIQLGGTPAAGEYWVVTLTGLNTTLSVDAMLTVLYAALADGTISAGELSALNLSGSQTVYSKPGAGDTANDIAIDLASKIQGLFISTSTLTATVTAGLSLEFAGTVAAGALWRFTLTDEAGSTVLGTFDYLAAQGDDLTDVAAGVAAKINDPLVPSGFKAAADGARLMILRSSGSVAFGAKLKIGAGANNVIGAQAPQILVTTGVGGAAFYAEVSIGIDSDSGNGAGQVSVRPAAEGLGVVEITRKTVNAVQVFDFLTVELKGNVTSGETWTLTLSGKNRGTGLPFTPTTVYYVTKFGDTLSDIASQLGAQLQITAAAQFDVSVRGRVLTVSNALSTQDKEIDATVLVGVTDTANPTASTGLRTAGTAAVVPQLLFTPGNWANPQTVTVMAIDDLVLDGGDAQVFPSFEERVNAIRGPLTITGGTLAGQERFLNDPFRLPRRPTIRKPTARSTRSPWTSTATA
jgi:hypothetical protein